MLRSKLFRSSVHLRGIVMEIIRSLFEQIQVKLCQGLELVLGVFPSLKLGFLRLKDFSKCPGCASYFLRALYLHRNKTFLAPPIEGLQQTKTVYDVRYGPKKANVLDIYKASQTNSSKRDAAPVFALYVYGGDWCLGGKSWFSPLGKSLSLEGVTACLMNYTLLPEGSAMSLAEEVGLALDFVLEYAREMSGGTAQVKIVATSCGAHGTMMALLERARNGKRMPDCAVLMCGMFDLALQYEHQRSLGVHEVAPLKAAARGCEHFDEQSPVVILSNISKRTGCEDEMTLEAVHRLPPIVLMTGGLDEFVPSSHSDALHQALQNLGCKSRRIDYEDLAHCDMGTFSWGRYLYRDRSLPRHPFFRDFFEVVKGDSLQFIEH